MDGLDAPVLAGFLPNWKTQEEREKRRLEEEERRIEEWVHAVERAGQLVDVKLEMKEEEEEEAKERRREEYAMAVGGEGHEGEGHEGEEVRQQQHAEEGHESEGHECEGHASEGHECEEVRLARHLAVQRTPVVLVQRRAFPLPLKSGGAVIALY